MVNTVTINLPELRNLSYRWELPTSIREACDYHFLDRLSYPELANQAEFENEQYYVVKHGIRFQIVFQNGALETYAECMKRELDGEHCVHKTFWLSYRSMSYKWNGEVKTISIVLIQPARPKVRSGSQELEYLRSTTVVRPTDTSAFINSAPDNETRQHRKAIAHGFNYSSGVKSFADRAAQAMESKEKGDE